MILEDPSVSITSPIKAQLALESGETFDCMVGHDVDKGAEIVFNTSVCGYQEILSDPSYADQFVLFTSAHIGNVGITTEDTESTSIHAAGAFIKNPANFFSNWRSQNCLPNYLQQHNKPLIFSLETRAVTNILRTKGSMRAWVSTKNLSATELVSKAQQVVSLDDIDLAAKVSCTKSYVWDKGSSDLVKSYTENKNNNLPRRKIVVYDFGVKHNILRILVDFNSEVIVVPATTKAQDVIAMNPDGVLLSNGPGNPQICNYAIESVKQLLKHKIPLFGICLGYQILSLALGAKTKKMKFGHHGANHPVQDLATSKVYITSQNHGFEVDKNTIDSKIISHVSLFDGSLQGINIPEKLALGFQGHPEASPGPTDIQHELFNKFFRSMQG